LLKNHPWVKGKRWIHETEKCLKSGGYKEPSGQFTYYQMQRWASDYDLLTSYILETKDENYKAMANNIREKYFTYLQKQLLIDNILTEGFINWPLIRKQYFTIYETSEEKPWLLKNKE